LGAVDPIQRALVRRFVASAHLASQLEAALVGQGPVTASFRASRTLSPYLALLRENQRLSVLLRTGKGTENAPLAERLRELFGREENER